VRSGKRERLDSDFCVCQTNIADFKRCVELEGLCHCDKIPDVNNLQEERFILAHGFRGFGPWSTGSIKMGLW
jgi:hypothetical protein